VQPLANDFRKPAEERSGYAPLKVLLCKDCSLAQLSVVVNPSILYDYYSYVTSPTETMRRHFAAITKDIVEENRHGNVLEIGSNDGSLLEFLYTNGFNKCIGIDPAENLATAASKRSVRTITSLFDSDSARSAKELLGHVDTVIARHVFAHIDNWHSFIALIDSIAHQNTLVCIECPYCPDMLEKHEWDTIYHEHLSYMTVKAMNTMLSDTAFHLHRVIKYPIHGGSVMLMLRRNDHSSIRDISVDELLQTETVNQQEWKLFAAESEFQILQLRQYVEKLIQEGKTVVGFGASAKSTVAINACVFTRKELRFVTDTTELKQGRLCPGTDIPVVSEDELLIQQPDYAVCFCWNFRESVLKSQEEYRKRGGKFIFFVPKLEVI
jgi:novobiocin biosynthesis protein NovU/D-mycarose 3-C-methyltransferase